MRRLNVYLAGSSKGYIKKKFTDERSFDLSSAYSYLIILHIEAYTATAPVLNNAPPMISVIQCTPDASLPMTINAVNAAIEINTHRLNTSLFIRACSCIIAVGITHITSIVVDDG